MVIKKGNLFICSSIIMDGLYVITPYLNIVNNSILELSHNALPLKRKIIWLMKRIFSTFVLVTLT